MNKASESVAYLIFDVETVADGELISKVCFPNEKLSAAEAISKYREDLLQKTGRDFIASTFTIPVAIAVAKVNQEYSLIDLIALDEPEYRSYEMTKKFWQGWEHYQTPTFVTFNGRGFDMPVLELSAYRYGISLPGWYRTDAKSYDQPRNRYNTTSHIDLMDFFSNFGAVRMTGGLNLLANIIGKPGKTGVDGSKVQGMYDAGEIAAINDYCRCDVLDTFFVFLRSRVLTGNISLEKDQEIVRGTKQWLEERAGENAAYAHYLEHWGDWSSPSENR